MVNGNFHLQNGNDVEFKDDYFDKQDTDSLRAALEDLVKKTESAFPAQCWPRLQETVIANADGMRAWLRNDPRADFSPMRIEFGHEQRPVKVLQSTYSPRYTKFIWKTCERFVRLGFFYEYPIEI